jgi:hypothetical protein
MKNLTKKFLALAVVTTALFNAPQVSAQITQGAGGTLGANSPTTNGNVGIGTNAPRTELQIGQGISNLTFGTAPIYPNPFWGTGYIGFNAAKKTSTLWECLGDGGNNGGVAMWADVGGSFRIATIPRTSGSTATYSNAEIKAQARFIIYPNGKVLIGSESTSVGETLFTTGTLSGYKLFVEKGILTEKLKVAVKNTANWADYVFASDYKLKPLAEVEAFVKANKHLPGVPSAEEVVKDGIDMATMDAKLLEKVEELTLYLIELQKQNEALKIKVDALEKK